jgi:hypothetical protein
MILDKLAKLAENDINFYVVPEFPYDIENPIQ